MADWSGMGAAEPYIWTGGAGVIGRLMFHARQVQRGKRKPLSWALAFDLPIALAMGWITYGLCVWLRLDPEPTISAAIAASYLGPYSVDSLFARAADRWVSERGNEEEKQK